MSKPISWYAHEYVRRFGMHLVPIEPKRKFPTADDWGENLLDTPESAEAFYEDRSDWNMGVALGPSGFCSLDIDSLADFQHICDCYGIDLQELIAKYPTIQGDPSKGMRIMFRVPADTELQYRKLNWKRQEDPLKSYTIFELRSATDGKQRQDVLPPSIHPSTGQPYQWITQPYDPWPEIPTWLLAMWRDWDKFLPQMRHMCPWAAPERAPVARKPRTVKKPQASVIDAYNDANDIEAELQRYGYTRRGKRYLSPHSGTGLPGVHIFKETNAAWVHHASDPLCSEESGKPVGPFDLFLYYEHNGDLTAAVRAASELLGMNAKTHSERITEAIQRVESAPARTMIACPSAQIPQTFTRVDYDLDNPLPFTTEKGAPLNHLENLREILRRMHVHVRYNVIKKDEEILIPGHSFSIDNEANASLAWVKSECSLFKMPVDSLGDYLTVISDQNLFNPVAEWVMSRPWDGRSRLQDFYDTVTGTDDHIAEKKQLKETLMRRWMISAVAAAFSPDGISAAGVLTIQGAQYLGKTKWFKSLAPESLNVIQDGMILRPDDKDSVKQICSFWMVELGELDATFRKSDLAALKAFLTRKRDVLRRAFARRESSYARRTVFFASVNPKEFLHDPTGNRRYWTIEANELDHSHSIDMQQLWAELLTMYQGGESYYLTSDEVAQLNEHNESFTAVDPIQERIDAKLAWDDAESLWRWTTATEVLLDIGFDRPTQSDATRAAAILRKLNGNRSKRAKGRNLLFCPQRIPTSY